jgi:serine/threonine-protein kinase
MSGRPFGKYTLLEKIGEGGMAEIWKASLRGVDDFEKILVVKKILPEFASSRQFITMFIQEAKVTSGLHHANVVQIYELGEENGEYYIAMEYVQGPDLLKTLTYAAKKKQHLPPELCLFIVVEVCKGLGYAHSATDISGKPLNMVHLDVSPSNILLSWEGEVKLTDFGVARATVEEEGPRDDRLKGKLGYMSPEQVTGKRIDRRSDLFSLGIILYELFTLKRLFLGRTDLQTLKNIRDANIEARLAKHPEIPDEVKDIIRRALTRNVDTRFQSAFEFEEAISQYLFERRLRVTPQSLGQHLRRLYEGTKGEIKQSSWTATSAPDLIPTEEDDDASNDALSEIEEPLESESSDEKTVAAIGQSAPTRLESSLFRFKSKESGIFGPVTFTNLQQLMETHSVAPDELVSVNGEGWRPVREVTQLTENIGSTFRLEPDHLLYSGDFGPRNSVDVVARLCRGPQERRLVITRDLHRKEIYFRKGKVVHITSNRKRELFGSVLVQKGVITQDQLDRAVSEIQTNGGPLGTVLVRLGFLEQADLFRILEIQFREKFVSLFSWEDASYQVYRDTHPPHRTAPFMIDPLPAIAEGVRRYVDTDILREYIEDRDGVSVRLTGSPPFDASRLKLTPKEHRIHMGLLARPTTVPTLMKTYGKTDDGRHTLYFVLFLLHQTEHIRVG